MSAALRWQYLKLGVQDTQIQRQTGHREFCGQIANTGDFQLVLYTNHNVAYTRTNVSPIQIEYTVHKRVEYRPRVKWG